MKNQYELKFEKMITTMILSDKNHSHNQVDLFMDFHQNSCNYYDELCHALFLLSSGQSDHILWLTPSGMPYLAPARKREEDHQFLTRDQIPEFKDDLVDQLETALNSFRWLFPTNTDSDAEFVSTS